MRLFYIHQHYIDPKDEWGGSRSHEFAKRLAKDRYDVLIITAERTKIFKISKSQKTEYGYKVLKVANPYNNKFPYYLRSISFIIFSLKTTLYLIKNARKNDIIFATSTPLTVGIPAIILRFLKGTKYIFEVRDLWPEMPISLGLFKSKFSQYILYGMEKLIYFYADHIVFLSNPMLRTSIKKYPFIKSKISNIENSCDPYFIKKENNNYQNKQFKLCYFGSLGVLNNLDYWINFFRILVHENKFKEISLDIYGKGKTFNELRKKIIKYRLVNYINLKGNLKKSEVFEKMKNYDFSICSFLPIPEMTKNSSNKFFDAISSNVPILINYRGWQKEIIIRHNIGLTVNPDYKIGANEFLTNVKTFKPSKAGFEILRNRFNRDVHYEKLRKIIQNIDKKK